MAKTQTGKNQPISGPKKKGSTLEEFHQEAMELLDFQSSYIKQMQQTPGAAPNAESFEQIQRMSERLLRQFEVAARAKSHLKQTKVPDELPALSDEEMKMWTALLMDKHKGAHS